MMQLRRSSERGNAEHGWLHSRHTFSFANYFDPSFMGFSVLRVINEDRIEGGTGFATHPHADMEIISYVIDGALEHRDSMGHSTIIKPGEIQRMSAGTGVKHSEYNYSKDKQTHFLQIWIVPDKSGYPPSYGQMNFESKLADSHFILLASQKGRDHSVALNQDVDLYLGKSKSESNVVHKTSPQRSLWIQMVNGEMTIENQKLQTGDGLALQDYSELHISAKPGSEYLLFDMPTIK